MYKRQVGVLVEARDDFVAELQQLLFQGLQQFDQGQGQRTFGGSHRLGAAKLLGVGEGVQPFFISFRAVDVYKRQSGRRS